MMRYFQLLRTDLDVSPALNSIMRRSDLWNQHPIRTQHPDTAHSQVEDILLRFNEIESENIARIINDKECVNYPAFRELPLMRPLIFGLMTIVEGEQLGRVMITKLSPGKRILPHEDKGAPATYYDRYHVVLNSAPGCLFRTGDETVYMKTGELWWFDNTVEHEVINNSCEDRVHLIIDIRTFQ
jgi:hypothetical protein